MSTTSPVANLPQQLPCKLQANFPKVSATSVANVLKIRWFMTGPVDISGKFDTGINDAGGHNCPGVVGASGTP